MHVWRAVPPWMNVSLARMHLLEWPRVLSVRQAFFVTQMVLPLPSWKLTKSVQPAPFVMKARRILQPVVVRAIFVLKVRRRRFHVPLGRLENPLVSLAKESVPPVPKGTIVYWPLPLSLGSVKLAFFVWLALRDRNKIPVLRVLVPLVLALSAMLTVSLVQLAAFVKRGRPKVKTVQLVLIVHPGPRFPSYVPKARTVRY
jgi:hypothetical protein